MRLRIPADLLEQIARYKCVAFVGAGFSMFGGYPDWTSLLNSLCSSAAANCVTRSNSARIGHIKRHIKSRKLQAAATLIEKTLSLMKLKHAIREEFSIQRIQNLTEEKYAELERRLLLLVSSPWAGIVTTNYDDLIERAYELSERRGDPIEKVVVKSPNDDLGAVLNQSYMRRHFFVKIHGCVSVNKYILTKEEYRDSYLKEDKIRFFLNALMMNHSLVFIGCSCEDEIMSIRRNLLDCYGGSIPMSWAILPRTKYNLERSSKLSEEFHVESLFYDTDSKLLDPHERYVSYLESFLRNRGVMHRDPLVREQIDLPTEQKIKVQDLLDQKILSWIRRLPEQKIRHADLVNNDYIENVGVKSKLDFIDIRKMSSKERLYRVRFLTVIGLLEEEREFNWIYARMKPSTSRCIDRVDS